MKARVRWKKETEVTIVLEDMSGIVTVLACLASELSRSCLRLRSVRSELGSSIFPICVFSQVCGRGDCCSLRV